MENHTSTLAPLFEHAGYRLLKPLGQGGMGQVYLAEDIQLARQVAVKLVASRGNAEQGLQEARMLARLNHANIVQIHSVFELEQQLAIVMEYVPGQTLFEYQYSHMANMTQKLGLLCQIAEGLAAAHQQGIIHCDLKPANILLDHQQQVKITDFGIARLSHHTSAASFTYGSQAYMSPEQLMDKALDYRSDLFSFGILAFHLLSGWHPFGTGDNQQLAKRIVEGEAMCAHKNIPGVPEALAELLNQLLAALPAKRPSDTLELAQRLRAIHKTMVNDDIISQATLVHKPQRKPVLQRPWFKRAALSLTALSLIAALGVAGYQIFKPEPKMLVVLEPELTTTDQAFLPQAQLVAATVDDALRQSVINSDNMRLIPRSEAKGIEGIKNIALATGATDIIQSSLHCNQVKCDISLSQISGKDYTVQKQKQWPALYEGIIEKREEVEDTLTEMFGVYSERTKLKINVESFEKYLDIYVELNYRKGASEKLLYELKAIRGRIPATYYFSVYREIVLELYDESMNKSYLTGLISDVDLSGSYKKSYNASLLLSSVYTSLGNFDKALSNLNLAEKRGANTATINEMKAYLNLSRGNYELASSLYEKSSKLRKSIVLEYNLALSYWWSGKVEPAKLVLLEIVRQKPDYKPAVRLLSSLYITIGNVKEAVAVYSGMSIDAMNNLDLLNLSSYYMLVGNFKLSLEYSKYAYEKFSNKSSSVLNYADSLKLAGMEGYELYYEKVVELTKNSDDLDSLLSFSQAQAHLGRAREALSSILKARDKSSSNPEVSFTYALVNTLIGEDVSAIVGVEEALKEGVNSEWFNFPWFKPLCDYQDFIVISKSQKLNICD